MDRAETTGLGIAVAGHAALLAGIALGLGPTSLPVPKSDPIEVSFVDEVGLESTSPTPASEAPAPKLADVPAPVQLSEPPPMPVIQPTPAPPPPRPQPRAAPQPKAMARPQPPRTAPAQPKEKPQPKQVRTKSGGRLNGLLNGITDSDSPGRSTTPPAQKAGAAVQASLARAVRDQIKPHWKAPTGADAEQLRTELSIWLSKSGSVSRVEVIRTTGQTGSNRPQVKLHQEQAVRAVRLASPFRLPAEYYDAWKHLSPIGFDKRLSQ